METVTPATTVWTQDSAKSEKRDLWTAMKRGFRSRCPRCGEGKLFCAFLKVDNHCSVCGLDYTPHRADDLPAYLVIVIVGHIIVPLILIDRSGDKPKVLVGKRHDNVVFMPGKYVFPGGRVDKSDNRIPVAAPISRELEANLLKGSPKISASRARALAVAAIREACEETGLCLGRKVEQPSTLDGPWKPFTDAGLLPDPSSLFLIARAITPPGRVRRFDTRFFTADASSIAHRVEGVIHADAELVELVWVEIGSKPLADAHAMTKNVLA